MEMTQDGTLALQFKPAALDNARRAYEQKRIEEYNTRPGNLNEKDGYNCPICQNRGMFAVENESGFMALKRCKCAAIRKSIQLAKQSGGYDLMQRCKLSNFTTALPWQADMLATVKAYIAEGDKAWLYSGGQSGAGKTHLCTAAFREFFKHNIPGQYVMWREIARKYTRGSFAESEVIDRMISELSSAPALYIDDLFKTDFERGPSQTEKDFAFEIINTRYNRKLPTIISSELTLSELAKLDEAIAGRIRERCGDYVLSIKKDASKNYRLVTE